MKISPSSAVSSNSKLKQGTLFSFFAKKTQNTKTPAKSSASSTTTNNSNKVVSTIAQPASATKSPPSASSSVSPSPRGNSNKSIKTKGTTNANQWKQVKIGDRLQVWWPGDEMYYAGTVDQQRINRQGMGTSFFSVRYDDGDVEWIDLSQEIFQFLASQQESPKSPKRLDSTTTTTTTTTNASASASTSKRPRRSIAASEDSDDEEHVWDDKSEGSSDDDDGSVFQEDPNDKGDDEEDDDDMDQWMVTDDEVDDDPAVSSPPPRKRAKKSSTTVRVTRHPGDGATKSKTGTSTSNASLGQFANVPTTTASASTPQSSKKSIVTPSQSAAVSISQTPTLQRTAVVTSSSSSTNKQVTAIPYIKGAVNVRGAHVHNHLAFLQNPRDIHGNRPGDANYNPRTLMVVPADWNRHMGKMTNAVQQWWGLKAQYFDTVLLFKTGKFYEMFHMDADVGVEVLQLSYMKGVDAHAGFPEISYGPMADKLVRAGYKVARVEQTETPDQLQQRKQKTPRGQKKPAVVNREVCSILSLGTRTFCALDDERAVNQLEEDGSASSNSVGPLLAIAQVTMDTSMESDSQDGQVQPVCEYGITMVDAVRATVTVGQFADDVLQSRLNTLLTRFAPSEILIPPNASPTLRSVLKSYLSSGRTTCRVETVHTQEVFPKSTALNPKHRQHLERQNGKVHPWNVSETLQELHRRRYYPRSSKNTATDSIRRWPPVLQALIDGEADLCLQSFGAALYYLQRHLIDHGILSMGIVKAYIPESTMCVEAPKEGATDDRVGPSLQLALQRSQQEEDPSSSNLEITDPLADLSNVSSAESNITHMSLDGTTLFNLEILTNAVDHKVAGSLWSKINYCKSPAGARFLRAWLLRPLFRKADIDRRADAVQELATGAGAVALQETRQHVLSKLGDLDRLLSRIHTMSGSAAFSREDAEEGGIQYHPDERAVLYESATYTKRKVNDFSKALHGLRRACQIPELFADLELDEKGLLCKLVRGQSQGGCFPEMSEELDWFFDNFDCSKAVKGHFEPVRGVDDVYDEACDKISQILGELEDYREEMCQQFPSRHNVSSKWKYINTKPENKDKYLIELPAYIEVPDDFLVKGKRGSGNKQINKYRSSVVASLVQELERAIEIQQSRKVKGMQLIFAKFDSKRSLWRAAAQAAAMLDALGSLAKVATKPGFCRPIILECDISQEPLLDIVQGRHPCVESSNIHTTDFVPNDVQLGVCRDGTGDAAKLLLLSGPNMGGKSTLLRQTCLMAILAQLGSFVPAESCSLTPVDCIYTRLGASDRILLGQSTFFVELAETAAALRGATRRSLVIMDELGRGTSTFDGTAIAGATVKHLIERSQCLTLFATHYHSLLDEWKDRPKVRLGHMQCHVDDSTDHSITFLYTLGPGTCPKSFGINVARLACLPDEVLQNAKRVSQDFEEQMTDSSESSSDPKTAIENAIDQGRWEDLELLWKQLQG
eukprot:Nitzschia sp. Nitz4//scaffold56_size114212//6007//10459//NITZ4_003930-RA/size114212-processed-gene-0.30-mRNA-1//1//CDS//3329554646//5604//frame0